MSSKAIWHSIIFRRPFWLNIIKRWLWKGKTKLMQRGSHSAITIKGLFIQLIIGRSYISNTTVIIWSTPWKRISTKSKMALSLFLRLTVPVTMATPTRRYSVSPGRSCYFHSSFCSLRSGMRANTLSSRNSQLRRRRKRSSEIDLTWYLNYKNQMFT